MKAIDWRKTCCWTRDVIILCTKFVVQLSKAMMEGDTWLASSCRSFTRWKDIYLIYKLQMTLQDTCKWRSLLIIIIIKFLFQLLESSFSHKAKKKYFKELLKGARLTSPETMHSLTPKREGLINKLILPNLRPKFWPKRSGL